MGRKVRAPQGKALDNVQQGRPWESATENRPPRADFAGQYDLFMAIVLQSRRGVRVKRWGKSPPVAVVTRQAWQTPFGARPNRRTLEAGPAKVLG